MLCSTAGTRTPRRKNTSKRSHESSVSGSPGTRLGLHSCPPPINGCAICAITQPSPVMPPARRTRVAPVPAAIAAPSPSTTQPICLAAAGTLREQPPTTQKKQKKQKTENTKKNKKTKTKTEKTQNEKQKNTLHTFFIFIPNERKMKSFPPDSTSYNELP